MRRRPTVLMYHGFSAGHRADDPYHLCVADDRLASQLAHLRERRWQPLDLDDYLHRLDRPRPGPSFLMTIDDALRSVLTHGAPVLERAGVPSVLFVPPALIGGTTGWLAHQPDEPILDADGLRALASTGMELGVHGWDHTSMIGMSDAELRTNVVTSAEHLADLVGRRPRAFAYPFGDVDARAVAAVRQAGYEVGFAVYADHGRHALSRTDVKPEDSLAAFRLKLLPGARYRVLWRAVGVVRPVRRFVRRTAQQSPHQYSRSRGQ